jgi:VWFA-related protein
MVGNGTRGALFKMRFQLSILLLLPLATSGQVSNQEAVPVFRTGARLVQVSVTVLDKNGAGVTGLAPSDFTILDDGNPRPVAFLHFDGAPLAPAALATPHVQPGFFSNRPEAAGETTRNITALVMDNLNTPLEQNLTVRSQMMRYLMTLAPQTQVAIYLMGHEGLKVIYDFSDDAAALRAKLEKLRLTETTTTIEDHDRAVAEAEAYVELIAEVNPGMVQHAIEMATRELEITSTANSLARRLRMESSLAAMEMLGAHVSGIPGRKSLVWIGAGFSMFSMTGAVRVGSSPDVEDFEAKAQATARRLAQQGIVLYIVDSQGLSNTKERQATWGGKPLPLRGKGNFDAVRESEAASADPRPAMELLASVTGGRYFYSTNEMAAGFKQALADTQGAYTVGFYLPDDPDNNWHKLKVHVNHSGVSVYNREGYLSTIGPPRPVQWNAERWREAFANPIGSTAIPLTATCARTSSGELALSLSVDANALLARPDGAAMKSDLDIGIVERAADGSTHVTRSGLTATIPAAQWLETLQRGLVYEKKWKVHPGTTSLRVIVEDVRTGQHGSLDIRVSNLPN